MAVDPVIVPEHVARLMPEWHGFSQLLDHPEHRGVECGGEPKHLPLAVMEDQEDIENVEADCADRKEVNRP